MDTLSDLRREHDRLAAETTELRRCNTLMAHMLREAGADVPAVCDRYDSYGPLGTTARLMRFRDGRDRRVPRTWDQYHDAIAELRREHGDVSQRSRQLRDLCVVHSIEPPALRGRDLDRESLRIAWDYADSAVLSAR